MPGLFIASTAPRAGKNLMCFALGLMLQKAGLSPGYMKPLGQSLKRSEEGNGDVDAFMVREILGLNDPPELITPVMMPEDWRALSLTDDRHRTELLKKVRSGYAKLRHKRKSMLVSGTGAFPSAGRFCGLDGLTLVKELGLKVLLVERYSLGVNYDALLCLRDSLGENLLGLMLNDVPDKAARDVKDLLVPYLEERGIPVMGCVPRAPALNAIRVADLAYGLSGRVVAGNAQARRSVQSFLIGTMQMDSFMSHLRSRKNCATIMGGDRTDLQLAALHSKCPCLILTGNLLPNEIIRTRAETLGVPLVVVQDDSYVVARKMEQILSGQKLRDLAQIRLGASLVSSSIDFDKLRRAWGI